jgi:hypothetical protein
MSWDFVTGGESGVDVSLLKGLAAPGEPLERLSHFFPPVLRTHAGI